MTGPRAVSIRYRVPYADTDQMHVVYYANYLAYFERARNELLRACGFTYRALEAEGFGLPVAEAHVCYLTPATYDDELEISAACEGFKGVRLTIRCEVRREGRLLAEGHTVHALVDLRTLRPARPTAALKEALGGGASAGHSA